MIELTNKYGEPLSEKEMQQQIEAEKRERRIFLLRNSLNLVFIILAVIAMIGIGIYLFNNNETIRFYACGIGVVGVLIKMIEVVFRMPGIGKKL